MMQKQSEDEQTKIEDDWENHPSPDTPANRKKAIKAQIILGIVGLIGILLPGILYWLKGK
jgi:hypothetical protein